MWGLYLRIGPSVLANNLLIVAAGLTYENPALPRGLSGFSDLH